MNVSHLPLFVCCLVVGMLKAWPSLYLFGDSLTSSGLEDLPRSWSSQLIDQLHGRCDVINRFVIKSKFYFIVHLNYFRGFFGYNSKNLRDIFTQIVPKYDSSLVAGAVLFIGVNDANDPEMNPMQVS